MAAALTKRHPTLALAALLLAAATAACSEPRTDDFTAGAGEVGDDGTHDVSPAGSDASSEDDHAVGQTSGDAGPFLGLGNIGLGSRTVGPNYRRYTWLDTVGEAVYLDWAGAGLDVISASAPSSLPAAQYTCNIPDTIGDKRKCWQGFPPVFAAARVGQDMVRLVHGREAWLPQDVDERLGPVYKTSFWGYHLVADGPSGGSHFLRSSEIHWSYYEPHRVRIVEHDPQHARVVYVNSEGDLISHVWKVGEPSIATTLVTHVSRPLAYVQAAVATMGPIQSGSLSFAVTDVVWDTTALESAKPSNQIFGLWTIGTYDLNAGAAQLYRVDNVQTQGPYGAVTLTPDSPGRVQFAAIGYQPRRDATSALEPHGLALVEAHGGGAPSLIAWLPQGVLHSVPLTGDRRLEVMGDAAGEEGHQLLLGPELGNAINVWVQGQQFEFRIVDLSWSGELRRNFALPPWPSELPQENIARLGLVGRTKHRIIVVGVGGEAIAFDLWGHAGAAAFDKGHLCDDLPPRGCDDDNPCTIATCDGKIGCQQWPVAGQTCDNGHGICTPKGATVTCQPTGG